MGSSAVKFGKTRKVYRYQESSAERKQVCRPECRVDLSMRPLPAVSREVIVLLGSNDRSKKRQSRHSQLPRAFEPPMNMKGLGILSIHRTNF